MNDIHSTQIWNRIIQPVLNCHTRIGITISPPLGSTPEHLTSISTITSEHLGLMGVRSYFVLEQDSNHRWHWHGLLGLSKERSGYKAQICEQLRTKLEGISFIDIIYKLRSCSAWITYTLKDQRFFMDQKNHLNIAKHPSLPRFKYGHDVDQPKSTADASTDVDGAVDGPIIVPIMDTLVDNF